MVEVLPSYRWRLQGDTNSGCFLYQGMKQWHFCAVPANVNGAEYSQCQLRMFVVQYPQRQEISPSCDMFIYYCCFLLIFERWGTCVTLEGSKAHSRSLSAIKTYAKKKAPKECIQQPLLKIELDHAVSCTCS